MSKPAQGTVHEIWMPLESEYTLPHISPALEVYPFTDEELLVNTRIDESPVPNWSFPPSNLSEVMWVHVH